MTKLKIILEVEDEDPTLVDPMDVAVNVIDDFGEDYVPLGVLDAEWIEEFRNGRTPGGKFEPEDVA